MPFFPNHNPDVDENIDDTVIPPKKKDKTDEDEPFDGPYGPGQGNPRMPRWRWRPGSGQRPTRNEVWMDSVESGWNF